MNTHTIQLYELALRYERRLSRSDAHQAWHLDVLRQSQSKDSQRASPWWRIVQERIARWFPSGEPDFPPTSA